VNRSDHAPFEKKGVTVFPPRRLFELLRCLGVRVDEVDRCVDVVNRGVDVVKGTLLQPLSEGIIFLVREILVRFFKELLGAVQTTGVVQTGIDRRMIIQVFAVVDGRSLDIGDRVIDSANRFFLLMTQFATAAHFEMGARRAEVRQSMKISRMLTLSDGIARTEREEQTKQQSYSQKPSDRLRHCLSLKILRNVPVRAARKAWEAQHREHL
jgi:hypothetical protein